MLQLIGESRFVQVLRLLLSEINPKMCKSVITDCIEQLWCTWTKRGYGTEKSKCRRRNISLFRCRKKDSRFV